MKNWTVWLKGLISAFITGAASAVALMIVDPVEFNIQDGLSKTLTVAVVAGLLGAANYLKQSPLPNGGTK